MNFVNKRKNYEKPFIIIIFVVWDYVEQRNLAIAYTKILESWRMEIHFKLWTRKGFAELWWTRILQFFDWVSCHILPLFMWLLHWWFHFKDKEPRMLNQRLHFNYINQIFVHCTYWLVGDSFLGNSIMLKSPTLI